MMAAQVRRGIALVYKNATSFARRRRRSSASESSLRPVCEEATLGWFHCRSVKKPNWRANGGRLGWGHPGAALFRTASVTGWMAVLRGAERRPPVVAPPAVPDENAAVRAKRLDALFAGLESTKVEEEHDVAEIWRLWLQSGNAEVDAQMLDAVPALGQHTGDGHAHPR